MELNRHERVVQVWDAEFCPNPIPDGYTGVMFYAGGSSAAHTWDAAELDRVQHLPRLPIWVPTPGYENPRQVALQVVRRLHELGVPPGVDACGYRACVLWDFETGKEPDPRWYRTAAEVVHNRGYGNLGYANRTIAAHLPVRSGLVVADPYTQPVVGRMHGEIGTQYNWGFDVPGGTIDQDVFYESALRHFWQPR